MGYIASVDRFDEEALRTAAVAGSTMASFAVEDFGLDRTRTLTQSDIKTRFDAFVDLTRFNSLS